MTNLDVFTLALGNWVKPIVMDAIMPKISLPPVVDSIKNTVAGFLGINLDSYDLKEELSFLAEPCINYLLEPNIKKYMGHLPDEKIPEMVNSFIDSFIKQAKTKGHVSIFGMEFEEMAFLNFKNEFNGGLSKIKKAPTQQQTATKVSEVTPPPPSTPVSHQSPEHTV